MGEKLDNMLSRHAAAQNDKGFIEDAAWAKSFQGEFEDTCAKAEKTNAETKKMVEASKCKRVKRSEALAANGDRTKASSSAAGLGPGCGTLSVSAPHATGGGAAKPRGEHR